MGFVRRYPYFPAQNVITQIEGVIIADLTPPGGVAGVGTGVCAMIGEFADVTYGVQINPASGAVSTFAQPVEIFSAQDLANKVGGFDPTIGEFGNSGGNAFAELKNHTYPRLILVPVNLASPFGARLVRALPTNTGPTTPTPVVPMAGATASAATQFLDASAHRLNSAQAVNFSDQAAYASGVDGIATAATGTTQTFASAGTNFGSTGAAPVTEGDILVLGVIAQSGPQGEDAGTFRVTGTAPANSAALGAEVVGTGVAPYALAAGQTVEVSVDGGAGVTATFLATAAALTAGSAGPYTVTVGETLILTINGVSTTITMPALVAQTAAQTATALNALNTPGVLFSNSGTSLVITSTQLGSGSEIHFTGGTGAGVFSFSTTDTFGTGSAVNIAATTQAEVTTLLTAELTGTTVSGAASTVIKTTATGPTHTLQVIAGGTTALALGLPTTLATGIAAGTLNQIVVEAMDGSSTTWEAGTALAWRLHTGATADSYGSGKGASITSANQFAFDVPMRPLDATIAAATILQPQNPAPAPGAASWSPTSGLECVTLASVVFATNVQAPNKPVNASLEALYLAAFNALLDNSEPAADVDLVCTARTSTNIRSFMNQHVNAASGQGTGRMGTVSPALTVVALNTVLGAADPGVGAQRAERVVYNWPGYQNFVSDAVGFNLTGADGSTVTDGNLDCFLSTQAVSAISQLPPQNNPGQLAQPIPSIMANVLDFQRGLTTNLGINEYTALKAAGIMALRFDRVAGPIFQSGVTTSLTPGQTAISRRRMADFIEDSLAQNYQQFSKLPVTTSLQDNLVSETVSFLEDLLSANNPANQQIVAYSVDDKSGNTPATLAAGIFVVIVNVQLLATADFLVLQVTASNQSIQVTQLPTQQVSGAS